MSKKVKLDKKTYDLVKKLVVVGLDGETFVKMASDPDAQAGFFVGMLIGGTSYTFGCISVKDEPFLKGFRKSVDAALTTLYTKGLITKDELDNSGFR